MYLDEAPLDLEDPVPSTPAPAPLAIRRAHDLARFVPELTLRFTYLNESTNPAVLYDSRIDAWQWPVHLGATFELRLVWGLEGWIIPPVSAAPSVWGWP
jgi:hypothetical protein